MLSAGNEAILDAAEKIGKSSLSRTNYKDMFDMLLGTSANFDGMASMQEAALQIARSLLSGITDNEDVIKDYAEDILKDFIGANGWIVDFIDQESGSLNSAAFDAGGSVSQSFYDGMASVAGELMRSDQLARIMSGLFDSTIEDILSSGLDEAGMENFISSFNLLPEGTQDALMSAYPQLESFFTMISSGAYDSEEALRQLMSVLEQMNMDTLAMTSAPTQKAANAFASISGDTS